MNANEKSTPEERSMSTLFFQNRHLLVLSIVIVLVAGASAYITLPRAEDPIITNRNPLVITQYPGADATRVEALVTEVIERELDEIDEIKDINSTSSAGVSVVAIELKDEITKQNNEQVFSKIRDALADAEIQLPDGALAPNFDDQRSAIAYTLIVALSDSINDEPNLPILSRVAEDLADQFRNVSGTEIVRLFGEADEEILVTLDGEESVALGLDPDSVAGILRTADAKTPSGILRGADRDQLVEVDGEFTTIDRIKSIPLIDNQGNSVVRLGDIALVQRTIETPTNTIAFANGQRSVLVGARMQEGIRVDYWAEAARETLNKYTAQFGDGVEFDIIFDQSQYTRQKLDELTGNLLAGAAVVVLVIFLMMGWRSALLVSSSLPLVTGLTLFLLGVFDIKIHQMSIFGMIIALGLLIDNAIVAVDEVTHRLSKVGRLEAVRQTLHHLFIPLLASTLTTMLAFAPIPLLPGGAGDFVGSIGGSVILALGASFLVSMTIIVSLAGLLGHPRGATDDSRLMRYWKSGLQFNWTTKLTRWGLLNGFQRPIVPILIALTPGIFGFFAATQLGSQFFPPVDRDMFGFRIWLPRGTALEHSAEVAKKYEEYLLQHPDVEEVHWLAGGYFPAVYYNQMNGNDNTPSYIQGIIKTTSFEATEYLVPLLQEETSRAFPSAQIVMQEFGQGPPSSADIQYRLYGNDADKLKDLGEQMRLVLQQHPQVTATQMSVERGQPKLWVNANEDKARLVGLSLNDISAQLSNRLEGQAAGSIIEEPEEIPVRVRYDDAFRRDVESLASVWLTQNSGGESRWLPLEIVGDLEMRPETAALTRENSQQINTISGYTTGDALPIDVTNEVLAELEANGFGLPDGYRLELGGNAEQEGEAVGNLGKFLPVLVVLMVALVILTFRSVRLAILLGVIAIMSVGLGQLATWGMGLPVSFNTILGTIGLIGVALNDSIVVIAALEANPKARVGDPAAVTEEVMGCMRHVISTTFTTIGGFLPILLFTGGDFWPSLAIVLAGGVAGATLMAVMFIPGAYILLHNPHRLRLLIN
jgi:multidrug efflux pump subunit AcrB